MFDEQQLTIDTFNCFKRQGTRSRQGQADVQVEYIMNEGARFFDDAGNHGEPEVEVTVLNTIDVIPMDVITDSALTRKWMLREVSQKDSWTTVWRATVDIS